MRERQNSPPPSKRDQWASVATALASPHKKVVGKVSEMCKKRVNKLRMILDIYLCIPLYFHKGRE